MNNGKWCVMVVKFVLGNAIQTMIENDIYQYLSSYPKPQKAGKLKWFSNLCIHYHIYLVGFVVKFRSNGKFNSAFVLVFNLIMDMQNI